MSQLIAGVDEAGRGPLAGPVVAAAVILDPANSIVGLRDSKQLSEKRREALFEAITAQALAWCVARAEVEEIDRLNILHATLLAMQRAVEGLSPRPGQVIVDGNRCPPVGPPCRAIVKGDALEPAISAASILAKVTRDREMLALHARHPQYGFDVHKGYPTAQHRKMLEKYGVTDSHRKSFRPVLEIASRGISSA